MAIAQRVLLADFALANPLYANARVTVQEADIANGGVATTTKATLYTTPTGTTEEANPFLLDGSGKLSRPVYVDRPVIARITDAQTPSHDTGVIGLMARFRGDWAAGTVYQVSDVVRDGAAGNNTSHLYICLETNTAAVWASDLSAVRWVLYLASPEPGIATEGQGFNPLAYGAVGDGVADDTLAIQAALDAVSSVGGLVLIPSGYTFRFRSTLLVKSRTTIDGGGILSVLPFAQWEGGSPYRGISNVNHAAGSITDEDITIRNIVIDYTAIGAIDGTEHVIRARQARRIRVEQSTISGGASSVALLACDDTQEIGNTYLDFYNCGSDHWDQPNNVRVVGCHMKTSSTAQMVNFNPEPSTGTVTGYIADGFTMTGCTLVSTSAAAEPCQIEPLTTGNIVKNVTISGNVFKNTYLVARGDVRGLTISSNTFSNFAGTTSAIYATTRFSVLPSVVVITGNVIRDPLTASPSEAVITARSPSAIVTNNVIMGSGYSASAISGVGEEVISIANYVEAGAVAGRLQGGARVVNGTNSYWGWTDTNGFYPRMYLQNDDNWIWRSTNSDGSDRTVASLQAADDTSELRWSAPTLWNNYTYHQVVEVSATGTTISDALELTADIVEISTCTAGVADGVVLQPIDGQFQTLINTSAETLKVYPNNSGSAQIDNGGASVAVTILAGKSKTFTRVATGDFRTVAAT